jgi:uncharacterized membrane protein
MNFDPIFSASPVIQIHLAAALLALITGTIMWRRPKGTPSHKLIGRFFMVLMLVTAASAIFIQEINEGHYSWIHIFVPVTLYSIVSALWAIKNRNIKRHIQAVQGLFFLALIIPGVFTLMPGRILFAVFFGS